MPGPEHDSPTSPISPTRPTNGIFGVAASGDRTSAIADDLYDHLERVADPAAVWTAIKTDLDQRLARRVDRERQTPVDLGQGERGMTPVQPDATMPSGRPYLGFDRESAEYDRLKPDLLKTAEGQYVVFVGEAMVGPVDTFSDALREGYRKFGRGPLFVKQVLAQEPVVHITRDVTPCRP